ncbi:MAG: hypothetical protein ACREU7_05785 [Burkholderiales bacterium]
MLSRILFRLFCLSCLTAAPPAGGVQRLDLELGHIEAGPVSADDVAAVLVLDDNDAVELRVFASRLRLPEKTALDRLEIRCSNGTLNESGIACPEGEFRSHHSVHGEIAGRISFGYDAASGAAQFALEPVTFGALAIEGALLYSRDGWEGEFTGQDLALPALRAVMEALHLWPAGYSDVTGKVDVALRARGAGKALTHLEGVIRAKEAGFFGPNSAEGVSLEATFELDLDDAWSIRADGRMTYGAVYIEPGLSFGEYRPGVAIDAPGEPIGFGLDLKWDPVEERLRISRLDLLHPGVVEAHARGDFGLGENRVVHSAELQLSGAAAGGLYTTYLQPFLLDTKFNALEAAGMIDVAARIEAGGLRELDVRFTDVHAYDGNGGFSVAGLDGELRVSSKAQAVQSILRWQGAGVYRLNLGPGELVLSSRNGDVEVQSWRDVPILDGALHIDALRVSDAGRPEMAVMLDGSLSPISMADLTQSLGWPVMSGRLTGEIEGLTWSRGRLIVGGRINIGLFDGSIIIRNLRLDDLFGLVPSLYADIDIQDLDLAQLTDRFSFGKIEGRLGGRIHGLELQAWQPVYFDAELATQEDDDSRHRINQRAVDNLGFIGGGATGSLSGGFLRYFQEYSYGRLGIRCRLYNGACELGGVEETEDGFRILTRGGLLPPWIEVKATGRSIGWNDLVEGLKSITSNRPEIR